MTSESVCVFVPSWEGRAIWSWQWRSLL